VVVLDIGSSVGVSAVHFASSPKVLRVISVGPNPTIAEEIDDNPGTLGSSVDLEPLRNIRVLDVARAALAEFGYEQQKIQLRVGSVRSSQPLGIQANSADRPEKAEEPALEASDGVSLVAFVDGLHTKEGVRSDLEAVFQKNPRAVAILDDCRGSWGPFVQAGVVDFMENAREKYHFQPFGDLGPGVATSNLGIVYPDVVAAEAKRTLAEFSGLFSERLDLLRLLGREEELIGAVTLYKNQADRLRKENETLARRSAELEGRAAHYHSRRYKFADAFADRALRLPGISRLRRRKPGQ
jgi:hypothetical protein